MAKKVDRIDVVFNAIGFDSRQGTPLLELALEDFSFPIATWTRAQFLTARSAARRMVTKRSGVILMLSASPARMAIPLTGGFGVACAAIEGLSRTLAGELSPQGVRVVCLRPHRIGDTLPMAPEFPKMERESFRELLEGWTLLKRLPTLADVADTAAFLASRRDHRHSRKSHLRFKRRLIAVWPSLTSAADVSVPNFQAGPRQSLEPPRRRRAQQ